MKTINLIGFPSDRYWWYTDFPRVRFGELPFWNIGQRKTKRSLLLNSLCSRCLADIFSQTNQVEKKKVHTQGSWIADHPGFRNESWWNELGDYMGKVSVRAEIRPELKILAWFKKQGRNGAWACVVIVFSLKQDGGLEGENVAVRAEIHHVITTKFQPPYTGLKLQPRQKFTFFWGELGNVAAQCASILDWRYAWNYLKRSVQICSRASFQVPFEFRQVLV